jgi:hypothetical protein
VAVASVAGKIAVKQSLPDAAAELPVPGESATLTQLPPSHRLPLSVLDQEFRGLEDVTTIGNTVCLRVRNES